MLICLQMIDDPARRLAFIQVYERYRQPMFGIAMGILHDHHDAEDAVQAAFEYVAKNFGRFAAFNTGRQQAYLFLTVEHRALNILKANRKYVLTDLDAPAYADAGCDIPETGDADADILAKLPAAYRQVVLMRYGQDMSTREIARELGLRQDTIQKRLKRAREMLEEALSEEEVPR